MPKTEPIAEQNAVDVPLYTSLDAARYLRVPPWVAFALSGRHRPHPEELFELFFHRPFSPLAYPDDYGLRLHENEPRRISFRVLADLFMRSAVFHLAPTRERLERLHWEDGRHWFELSSRAFRADTEPTSFVAFDAESFTRRLDLYLNALGVQDRVAVTKLFALHFDRVELKDGVPVRLYPFTRDPTPDCPRTVVIDPQIRFGRPTVKGVPIDVIAERWRAGDSSAYLADDYDLTTDEVDEALRFEAAPSPFLFLPPFSLLG